jgi:hypothetical protein
LIDVFNLRKLNEVFHFANKIEMSFEGQQRRYKGVSKQQPLIRYSNDKRRVIKDKKANTSTSTELVPYKEGQTNFKGKDINFEQSRALGVVS